MVEAQGLTAEPQGEQGLRSSAFLIFMKVKDPSKDAVFDMKEVDFLKEFNQRYGRGIDTFESSAMEAMQRYAWPGNVRELHNVIERTYYLANPPVIRRADLPAFLTTCRERVVDEAWKDLPYQEAKDRAIELFEREYLNFNLTKYEWNISQAASACGMDRRTVHRLINRYELRKN